MPWDEIARQLQNGQSGGAVSQHLAKDCVALKEDGIKVPSSFKHGSNRRVRDETPTLARLAPAASKVSTPFVTGFDSLSEHILRRDEPGTCAFPVPKRWRG